jgi:hypothetical protein
LAKRLSAIDAFAAARPTQGPRHASRSRIAVYESPLGLDGIAISENPK